MNLSRSAFRRRAFVATAIAALLAAGCSSDSAKPASTAVDASAAANVAGGASSTVAASPETTAAETDAAGTTPAPTPATEPAETTAAETTPAETAPADTAAADTTLPPGATPGLDDYDQDGEPDPTCGTQDFGAGLVLRIPCEISTAHEPAEGTTLVDQSLFRLPGDNPVGFTGVSADLLEARDVDGRKVDIIIFNTDGLFAKNSAEIASPETMTNTVTAINNLWPGSSIQVRGHTDATGSPTTNQTLSEQRAATVAAFLQSHGVQARDINSVGLSSSEPLTLETNPDGSPNLAGRQFNRRVEIVLRLPG